MRKIVIRFIGIKKYSHLGVRYDYVGLNPNISRCIIGINPFKFRFIQYHKMQLKQGYYPSGIFCVTELGVLIAMVFKSWHKIKQKLCVSRKRTCYINGRLNIIGMHHNIVILKNLGIDIQDEDYNLN